MQSNYVNATQIRAQMEFPILKPSQNFKDSTDTFMNILSSRMKSNDSIQRQPIEAEQFSNQSKGSAVNNNVKPGNEPLKAYNKDPIKNTGATKADLVKDNEAVKSKSKSEKLDDMSESEKKEEISSLEAMIALLEELLAELDVKIVADVDPVFSKETILPVDNEGISPMELLSALVSNNFEKLQELLAKMQEGQKSPGITATIEKIAGMLEKMSGQDTKTSDQLKLIDSIVQDVKASGRDLISQMRAEVSQLIEKLKGQVSALRESLDSEATSKLNLESNSESKGLVNASQNFNINEAISTEQVQVEVEDGADSQTKNKDSKAETQMHAKQDGAVEGPLIQENDQSFDKYMVADNQIAKEPIMGNVKADKTQGFSPQRPLEPTVTNQVMMKVKLMAGENKQEVEMHLKPESLGKLSLKIIHERGEVLAKITAENQQVKEILESNMQMLKDALESSGLTVQNLSVSVGNNNNSGKENANESLARQAKNSIGIHATGQSIVDKNELRAKIENEYNTSQINLTA